MYLFSLAAAIVVLAAFLFRRRYDFSGRIVLITGGSRGLGLELAREILRRKASVAICARDPDELAAAERILSPSCGKVFTYRCDVSKAGEVAAMIDAIENGPGPIDVLINNAGMIAVGPAETMTQADYEAAMNVHFWGPVNTTLALLPRMERRGRGRIVNIASIGGKISVPHLLPYSASKFALVGFSEGLAAEVRRHGIRVTTVCPGLMRTGSQLNALMKGRHREEYGMFANLGNLPLLSVDAAEAARKIVRACERGRSEIVLTIPAKLGVWFHGLFPGATARLLGFANRYLPGPGGIGSSALPGSESGSPSVLGMARRRIDEAARRNNESGRSGEGRGETEHAA